MSAPLTDEETQWLVVACQVMVQNHEQLTPKESDAVQRLSAIIVRLLSEHAALKRNQCTEGERKVLEACSKMTIGMPSCAPRPPAKLGPIPKAGVMAVVEAELARREAEETPPVGAMVTPAHLVGRLTCTEEERRILDTMARVDDMALQMTAENEDTELDPDDPYVMVCVHELARREAERAKGGT